uniref:hypothetical protein n=2 Tax=Aeromonas veronii TaxID=654 RepID=UPI003D243AC7
ARGQSEALKATAIYSDQTQSDISDYAAWITEDAMTANVTRAGRAVGIEVGATRITASKDGVSSDAVTVEVTDAVITKVEIFPYPRNIPTGPMTFSVNQIKFLEAIATYSDGSQSNVSDTARWLIDNRGVVNDNTWLSYDESLPDIMAFGGVSFGRTNISASIAEVVSEALEVETTPWATAIDWSNGETYLYIKTPGLVEPEQYCNGLNLGGYAWQFSKKPSELYPVFQNNVYPVVYDGVLEYISPMGLLGWDTFVNVYDEDTDTFYLISSTIGFIEDLDDFLAIVYDDNSGFFDDIGKICISKGT